MARAVSTSLLAMTSAQTPRCPVGLSASRVNRPAKSANPHRRHVSTTMVPDEAFSTVGMPERAAASAPSAASAINPRVMRNMATTSCLKATVCRHRLW
jgi:hypothetical protein